jgi:hypothetical protein
MAMTSDRVLALAVAALCVAAASMVWSIVMIVRVAVDGYGFRKRSSISSTNVKCPPTGVTEKEVEP